MFQFLLFRLPLFSKWNIFFKKYSFFVFWVSLPLRFDRNVYFSVIGAFNKKRNQAKKTLLWWLFLKKRETARNKSCNVQYGCNPGQSVTKQTHKDPAIPYLSNYGKQSIHDARCNPIKSRWGWDVGTEADRDDNSRARSGRAGDVGVCVTMLTPCIVLHVPNSLLSSTFPCPYSISSPRPGTPRPHIAQHPLPLQPYLLTPLIEASKG